MRPPRFTGLLLLIFVTLTQITAAGGETSERGKPDVTRGKKIFAKYCAGCHGREGRGDGYKLPGPNPADLTAPSTKGRSEAELLKMIHEGNPNMPPWNIRLSRRDSRDVVAYIRSLESVIR